METITMPLKERRSQVISMLRPDEIRNHRVAEGLELNDMQVQELLDRAHEIAEFARGMSEISQTALQADSSDPTQRTVRGLLGTEGLFQARQRRETTTVDLPFPIISKADIVITDTGFRIVEIEPGKIRGLGYGAMVRSQANNTIGIGAEQALCGPTNGEPTAIMLSTRDKFHEPEMSLLAREVSYLHAITQHDAQLDPSGQLRIKHSSRIPPIKKAVMMSRLSNGTHVTEQDLRDNMHIVSDRREDIESKGALALLHNSGNIPEIEAILRNAFSDEMLFRLRCVIPETMHVNLLPKDRLEHVKASVTNSETGVFLKPMSDSGTRGIVTPAQKNEMQEILGKPKALGKFVIQQAKPTISFMMTSMDVLSGEINEAEMIVRLTVHVDQHGNIVEASVVGSPHEHLAHGGKKSVITNVEHVTQ